MRHRGGHRARAVIFAIAGILPAAPLRAGDADGPIFPIRGVVRTLKLATISSEFSARVAKVAVAEGGDVKQGDLMIEFDCRRQQAELEAALADEREMKVTLEANTYLAKRQAASAQDVDIAQARAAKAGASVSALRVQLEQCKVFAPFSGRVASVAIHEHELSAPGRPLATIVGDTDMEVGLIVPSKLLSQVKAGSTLPFTIDETGETLAVRVVRTAAMVDAISQTAMITAVFIEPKPRVIAGMSGTAQLPP